MTPWCLLYLLYNKCSLGIIFLAGALDVATCQKYLLFRADAKPFSMQVDRGNVGIGQGAGKKNLARVGYLELINHQMRESPYRYIRITVRTG